MILRCHGDESERVLREELARLGSDRNLMVAVLDSGAGTGTHGPSGAKPIDAPWDVDELDLGPPRDDARPDGARLVALPMDPEIAWRVEAMLPQVPAAGAIPTLMARKGVGPGGCVSCGEPALAPGHRCKACIRAVDVVLSLQL